MNAFIPTKVTVQPRISRVNPDTGVEEEFYVGEPQTFVIADLPPELQALVLQLYRRETQDGSEIG